MHVVDRLVQLMARLRAPDGCAWDREQTPQTLRSFLLEEAYELAEAIDRDDWPALREELGDLLLQIVFLSQIASERDAFCFADVAQGLADKLVRRHPHVFGDVEAQTAREAWQQWEQVKRLENESVASDGFRSRLGGIPRALPALLKAHRLADKAARAGIRWPSARALLGKIRDEIDELERAFEDEQQPRRREEELGDLLFAAASFARHVGIDPEAALQAANAKFARRFVEVERAAGRPLETFDAEQLDRLWQAAKRVPADPTRPDE
ncbi:MAG: nucleoside triphosphate pyrophosphohydrolase [Acidobacteriota bacterium]|nr:MAG: nucleoside triphosphate pyrophosphohydrolase [Acidobacteriota bacterium]